MSNEAKQYNEKRAERRFPINSIVHMTMSNNKKVTGRCCNISGSGMLVKADKPATVGGNVRLEIQEGKIDFKAEAEVVRIVEEDNAFLIALKVHQQLDS